MKEAINNIVETACDETLIDNWKKNLRLVEDLWRFNKDEFLKELLNFEKVIDQVDVYMKLGPRYSEFYNEIGKQLIYYKQYQKGLFYLEKATQIAPNSYNAHFDYAFNLKEGKKNNDIIIKHYERCIEIDDTDYVVCHNLGRIYSHHKNNYKKAAEIFRKGILNNPNSIDTMIELALAEEGLGHVDTARSILESALLADDSSDLGHNNLAFMLWSHYGEHELAKEHINKALKLAPKIALYWHTLAEVEWYGLNDKEKAVAALNQALKVQKSYKGAKVMLAEIEA